MFFMKYAVHEARRGATRYLITYLAVPFAKEQDRPSADPSPPQGGNSVIWKSQAGWDGRLAPFAPGARS